MSRGNDYLIETRLKKTVLYTVLLIGLVLTLAPFFWMFSTSFKTRAGIFSMPPQWLPADPTLAHYRKLFEEVDFFRHFIFPVSIIKSLTKKD